MDRIYESNAVERDDEAAFVPGEREAEPQSFRWLDAAAWSDRLLPQGVARRAVSLRVSVPRTEFARDERIPFAVTMKNQLPVPVTVETLSPVLWVWTVDGHTEASHVIDRDPPERAGRFRFDRGERKRFRKVWSGRFRVSEREWTEAAAGEHTIAARINVADADGAGLADETTVRID